MAETQEQNQIDSSQTLALLVGDRVAEPIVTPRESGGTRIMFDISEAFLKEKLREIKDELAQKWEKEGTVHIPIANINMPDLTKVLVIPRNATFGLFIESHQEAAAALITIFMVQKTKEDLISVAAYCHDRVNSFLYNYALSVALLHREDTRDIILPSLMSSFPAKFVGSNVVNKAKQEAAIVPRAVRSPIIIPQNYTANLREPEQRCAYFREDMGINLHHWHWHLVYPQRSGTVAIVAKDRRGELFYYMHHQIIARYNAERFCNDLPRVVPLSNLRAAIPEAYFSKLVTNNSSRPWAPRFANVALKDIDRPNDGLTVKISSFETWEKNIKDAIQKRMAKSLDGKDVSLAGDNGIDILGNMVESSMLSINRPTYGNYHNMGHVLICFCHDPDGKWEEGAAVMGDTATAMRDPVFYRWHNHINNIFLSLKDQATPYTKAALTFNNVKVTAFKVTSDERPANEFNTFWQQSIVDISRGLDFNPLGKTTIQFIHLNHEAFTYTINVNNTSNNQLVGYARIFMAPKLKEGGIAMEFDEQRKFMIELDKFRVDLKKGANVITQRSTDSSVTIPYERTFRDLDLNRPTDASQEYAFNFCGCGWPQHMLIPKGTEQGIEFDLFVMISDYNADKVVQDLTGLCNDAESYCGIQDRKYPDKKPMGYPFDRKAATTTKNLTDFLTPNMKVQNVVIKFTNKIVGVEAEETNPSVVSPNP